jgi:hypothetical protein
MKTEVLENKSIQELKELKKLVSNYGSIEELVESIDFEIERKKEQANISLNERFNLEMFKRLNMLQDYQIEFLRQNGILNLQSLIDCDIDDLLKNIYDSEFKNDLLFIREFYDMSNMPKLDAPEDEKAPKQYVKHNKIDDK